MIVVIDNYDSFTYNLVQALASLGAKVEVFRNDDIDAESVADRAPSGIVISPGPCGPNESGNSPSIVSELGAREVPVLGVCLGHQVIGSVYGATIDRAPRPMHGKTVRVGHDSRGIFTNVSSPFEAGLYHSLAVVEDTVPRDLVVSARSGEGVVMGLRHRELPIEGIQFHPESILTPDGETLLGNFLRLATHPTAGWRAMNRKGGW